MIYKAAEIILTLSATFKGSADQQCVDAKTDFAFLGHDNLFSQIYMTLPEGQTQVIARAQSISLILCLFRLVTCKFTEPQYKSAWDTLLSLLIFSTYALSIKREGRNLRVTIRAIFPGCVLARISILPKISRIWLCLRVQTDRCMARFLMFSKRISRYFESKQYRNPGQTRPGKMARMVTLRNLTKKKKKGNIAVAAVVAYLCGYARQ